MPGEEDLMKEKEGPTVIPHMLNALHSASLSNILRCLCMKLD